MRLCSPIPLVIIKFWLIASLPILFRGAMGGGRGELESNLCNLLFFRIKILIAAGAGRGKNKAKVFCWNPEGKKYAVLSNDSFLLSIAHPSDKKASSKTCK